MDRIEPIVEDPESQNFRRNGEDRRRAVSLLDPSARNGEAESDRSRAAPPSSRRRRPGEGGAAQERHKRQRLGVSSAVFCLDLIRPQILELFAGWQLPRVKFIRCRKPIDATAGRDMID